MEDLESSHMEVVLGNKQEPDEVESDNMKKVRIAVAGCAHGEMDKIYAALAEIEKDKKYKFDLLICCGDYQSVRNYGDLHHMHVSEKYRSLQTFYKYYSGEVIAPILTLFVGGNHEASGYLAELPNGGWVAPHIYYMGFANVIRFAGLRIAGLSGIFNAKEFNRGHYERPPYKNYSDIVSAYHVRNIDVWRLKQLRPADSDKSSNPIDIVISHDWPSGITDFGDKSWLLRVKPYFKEDIDKGKLGNPATMQLLYDIRPRYWLSAHLHVAFAALVPHYANEGEKEAYPTRFLSLDKPIPSRQFIQALELEVPVDAEMSLSYDPIWLAILKSTDKFTTVCKSNTFLPSLHGAERWDFRPNEEDLAAISHLKDLKVPENFRQTAPPLTQITANSKEVGPSSYYRNPQSAEFCSWLGISDLNKMLVDTTSDEVSLAYYLTANGSDSNEINIDRELFDDGEIFTIDTTPTTFLEDFQPPKWKQNEESQNNSTDVLQLKRRRVDIADDTIEE